MIPMEYDGKRWNTMENDGILSTEHLWITIGIPLDYYYNTMELVLEHRWITIITPWN